MKKVLAIALSTILMLGIFSGCSQEPNFFEVGYARVDISPDYSVPYASNTYSTGVEEHMYTTCIAFRDKDSTVLLFHNDLIGSYLDPIGFAIQDIEKATGVPKSNIMVAATHVHRAPRTGPTYSAMTNVARYHKDLRKWMVEAAVAAVADLKPAEMYTNSVMTEGLNFTRHYYMKDGSVGGDNFGSASSGYDRAVRDPDREMQLVKFTREGCKDIILVNFQTHPHSARGTYLTSDQVGSMRESLEKRLDCQFIYFTGAAGDVNPYSKLTSDSSPNGYQKKGIKMADYAVEANDTYTKVNTGDIKLINCLFDAEEKEGKLNKDVNMNVFTLGDVAFVMAPYEMFSENGEQIKAGSPYDTTIICTLAYDTLPYIPSYDGFEYEGVGLSYEAKESQFVRGTGEQLAEKYIEMLKELRK